MGVNIRVEPMKYLAVRDLDFSRHLRINPRWFEGQDTVICLVITKFISVNYLIMVIPVETQIYLHRYTVCAAFTSDF